MIKVDIQLLFTLLWPEQNLVVSLLVCQSVKLLFIFKDARLLYNVTSRGSGVVCVIWVTTS